LSTNPGENIKHTQLYFYSKVEFLFSVLGNAVLIIKEKVIALSNKKPIGNNSSAKEVDIATWIVLFYKHFLGFEN